jgi:anti-sigma-K factor RskA
MNCHEVREQMLEMMTGENPPQAVAHLRGCEACANELASLRSTMALLDEWQAPEPSPYFDTKLRARLKAEPEPAQGWRQWLLPLTGWKPAMAVALAAVMMVGITVYKQANVIVEPPQVIQPGSAVSDLQKLDKNQELYASFDLLDDDEDVNSNVNP